MRYIWVVVANTTEASIYSISEQQYQFNLLKKLFHPQSKLKEQDLEADGPGHFQKGSNYRKGKYAESISHKELEKKQFAKEICQTFEQGRIQNAYVGIVIVAESHFYGLINQETTPQIKQLIKHHVSKNYNYSCEKDLILKLKEDLRHCFNLIFTS